ncbi:MAG: hypothetical protein ACOC0H_08210 [Thermodesulfobacteriota bacterium]
MPVYTRVFRSVPLLWTVILIQSLLLVTGGWLFHQQSRRHSLDSIRRDLRLARQAYHHRIDAVRLSMETAATAEGFRTAVARADTSVLIPRLEGIARIANLGFAGVVTPDGRVMCRIHSENKNGRYPSGRNPTAELALSRGETVAGTVVLDRGILEAENPALAQQARIPVLFSEKGSIPMAVETAGIGISAAVPVITEGEPAGAVYGGVLLNRDEQLPAQIAKALFETDLQDSDSSGTVAVYFRNLLVAASPIEEGGPTLGFQMDLNIARRVLVAGETLAGTGTTGNEGMISAVHPLTDIFDQRVGMLSVGRRTGR